VTTAPWAESAPERRPSLWWRELRPALVVAAAVAASGLPLGLLWYALAPKVRLVMVGTTPYPVDPEPEGYVADDGWFVLIGFGAGVLAAIVVWILARRHRGPAMLAAVTLGGVAAGLLAAWLGSRFGLSEYLRLRAHAAPGTQFTRPPMLSSAHLRRWPPRADGPVLMQALAGAAVYTLLASFHPSADLDAEVAQPVAVWPPLSSDWTEQPALPGAPAPPAPGPGWPPPG
jgi:hypothetical protein